MVRTRHCIVSRMHIYKVGRSADAGRRLQMYPKGSMIIARLPVSHMRDSERVLLSLCRLKFVPRTDFGAEYFQTDACKVVGLVVMVAMMFPSVTRDDIRCHPDPATVSSDPDPTVTP